MTANETAKIESLTVWVTRPGAHEILIGGHRELLMWLQRPCYSHAAFDADLPTQDGKRRYHDFGWRAQRCDGQRMKPLFKQHARLGEAVWREVFLSLCPRGMPYAEGLIWQATPRGEEQFDGAPITLWHSLTDDRAWEAKCNTSHKRMLLEVDLLTCGVRRVSPSVLLRRGSELETPPGWVETDDISDELALEYWHAGPDPDLMPF